MSELLLQKGWKQVTPESAGWDFLSFGVRSGSFASGTGEVEIALVPLSRRCHVEAEGQEWQLGGRESVFAGMPWALYLPRDTAYPVKGDAEVEICGARAEYRREPVLRRPEDIEIEIRGPGNATRQINHILKPELPSERVLWRGAVGLSPPEQETSLVQHARPRFEQLTTIAHEHARSIR